MKLDTADLKSLSTEKLFALYRGVMKELLHRQIIRTTNAPAGDYAEYLVAKAFDGQLADNSAKSWDVDTPDGRHLQVKCRTIMDSTKMGQRQLSPFRTFDFDEAIIVLVNEHFGVWKAISLPVEVVKQHATYRRHVNGYVMHARNNVLSHPEAVDLTAELRRAATADPEK
jgi:hypothetical protein